MNTKVQCIELRSVRHTACFQNYSHLQKTDYRYLLSLSSVRFQNYCLMVYGYKVRENPPPISPLKKYIPKC